MTNGRLAFSKSKYCELWQCPKMAWLRKYKPEERVIDDALLARFRAGSEVGDLAMGLFGDFVEVTVHDGDGLDLGRMIEATAQEMAKGTPVICEASFSFEGLYCAVDILRRDGDGWAIYEVKSGTHSEKQVYRADIAYQKHVLERCGVAVTGTYLVCLDKDYVFDGRLDLARLFKIVDVSDEIPIESARIEDNLALAERLLASPDEPAIDLSVACNDPYPCAFWAYCSRNLPVPSVFDLYRMPFKDKIAYYRIGKASFADLEGDPGIKGVQRLRQIDFGLHSRDVFIDRRQIARFLEGLTYPLYFLDFETVQPAVPRYVGTKPYTQIPFQYSLHWVDCEGGELHHAEFLAEPEGDPRRALAERLCADIPVGACVTAYNKAFECARLRELADAFPDIADRLLDIEGNIVDLIVPFRAGWYYNRAMGGSFSIKRVLPALFPDDPELDYANLEDVHNGSDAMNAFAEMARMSDEGRRRMRAHLLEYCKLDTYAMVKIWQKLHEVAQQPPL